MRLLKTEAYHKISVSRLCNSAGVSRTAFYKNFASMDAVVLYKLAQIERDYNRHHSLDGDLRSRFEDFFSFIKADGDFELLLVKNNLFSLFEEQIRTDYLRYIAVQEGSELEGFQREYLPEYLSATVVSLLRKWSENGCREIPQQMADITVRLLFGYQKLLPMSKIAEAYKNIRSSDEVSSFNPASRFTLMTETMSFRHWHQATGSADYILLSSAYAYRATDISGSVRNLPGSLFRRSNISMSSSRTLTI